ncbi:TRP75-related protein [Anaplasma capra]|uniref:TRP75-related protein n=2 Tax=Anaplasma capra TaxID=1562740 RepID=UPI0021D5D187|nr:TRP75-related protein [Anaplasma capra]MCU7611592.1 TRP75-related protein [Anaplasma capra]
MSRLVFSLLGLVLFMTSCGGKYAFEMSRNYIPPYNPGGDLFDEDEDFAQSYEVYKKRRDDVLADTAGARGLRSGKEGYPEGRVGGRSGLRKRDVMEKLREYGAVPVDSVESDDLGMVNNEGVDLSRVEGARFLDVGLKPKNEENEKPMLPAGKSQKRLTTRFAVDGKVAAKRKGGAAPSSVPPAADVNAGSGKITPKGGAAPSEGAGSGKITSKGGAAPGGGALLPSAKSTADKKGGRAVDAKRSRSAKSGGSGTAGGSARESKDVKATKSATKKKEASGDVVKGSGDTKKKESIGSVPTVKAKSPAPTTVTGAKRVEGAVPVVEKPSDGSKESGAVVKGDSPAKKGGEPAVAGIDKSAGKKPAGVGVEKKPGATVADLNAKGKDSGTTGSGSNKARLGSDDRGGVVGGDFMDSWKPYDDEYDDDYIIQYMD